MSANKLPHPPLALYIHFPWCVKKCPYCDFNSHKATPEDDHQAYIRQLQHDLDQHHADEAQGRALQSIYLGGGTPSLFSAGLIEELLTSVSHRFSLARDIEITMEANPGSLEHDAFAAYRQAGVTRISLGVQSFTPDKLQTLGRIHNGDTAIRAVEALKQGGFRNFNIDLMHGLPAQSVDEALADLEQAIALQPGHLSWYQLTLEPRTLFYARPPRLPDEDTLADIEEAGQLLLQQSGYQQYEVSAYARTAALQARHNLNYWQFGDYIGIGAGAHGKATTRNGIQRYWKYRHPTVYQRAAGNFIQGHELLTDDACIYEFMLNALRLKNGIATELFTRHTGLDSRLLDQAVAEARRDGLLDPDPRRLRATALGYQFLNNLINYFSAEPVT